jgi:hypothetical protein
MDPWWARLLASQESIMEDDEEDEFNLNLVLGLGRNNEGIPLPKVLRGFRRRKAPNIERHRYAMHEKMMGDNAPIYGPGLFRWWYQMQRSLFLTI